MARKRGIKIRSYTLPIAVRSVLVLVKANTSVKTFVPCRLPIAMLVTLRGSKR